MKHFHTALLRSAKQKLRENDATAALALLRLLTELTPDDPEAAMLHGVAAQRCELVREAIAAYSRCFAAYAEDLHVIVNLAELCLHELDIDRAATLLRRAIALDPLVRHPAGYRARVLAMRAKEQAQ